MTFSLQGPGEAAKRAEERKMLKQEPISNVAEYIPFGVEIFGPFGPEGSCSYLKKYLQDFVVQETGDQRAGEFLWQRLGIAIICSVHHGLEELFV